MGKPGPKRLGGSRPRRAGPRRKKGSNYALSPPLLSAPENGRQLWLSERGETRERTEPAPTGVFDGKNVFVLRRWQE